MISVFILASALFGVAGRGLYVASTVLALRAETRITTEYEVRHSNIRRTRVYTRLEVIGESQHEVQ